MFASLVGQLDPKTGEMREFKLPAGTTPHSIINDRDGNIWFTGNGNGTIGKLDPRTGDIKVYPMPDPAARDPHTPVFDRERHAVVHAAELEHGGPPHPGDRRDQADDRCRRRDARPYGIIVNSQGSAVGRLQRGEQAGEHRSGDDGDRRNTRCRSPASRPRRLAILKDDTICYVDCRAGYLGRFDPKTGAIKEWPSPSGPTSQPYGIVVVNDIVWYNESGQRPDALVRFDPKTEKFQSWAIPSGVGIIRHMRVTPDGNLVIHQSSSNRVGLVTIEK